MVGWETSCLTKERAASKVYDLLLLRISILGGEFLIELRVPRVNLIQFRKMRS